MVPVVAAIGLFVTIVAVLRFSSWAEGWLASGASSVPVGSRLIAEVVQIPKEL